MLANILDKTSELRSKVASATVGSRPVVVGWSALTGGISSVRG
jgi:hypothetical protein